MKIFWLFLLFLFCHAPAFSQRPGVKKGVLRISLLKMSEKGHVDLYNEDGKLYCRVFRKGNDSLLKNVRSCYLDHGVLIFDTDSTYSGGKISVFVGNEKKYLDVQRIPGLVVAQSWTVFLKSIFFKMNPSAVMYTAGPNKGRRVAGAGNYSYIVKSVKNDWVFVECVKTCAECPRGSVLQGWIRWRDGGKLLIELYYFC
ncbi:MAG TPA: hypothetical protein VHD83_17165 [Puia sp.]|nr:hypothetical protein [Puia sp.]